MKRIFVLITALILTIAMVSCGTIEIVDTVSLTKLEVRLKEATLLEIYEGEELGLENFEATFYHVDGKIQEVSNLDIKGLSHNYNKNPKFDHLDRSDDSFEQEVIFTYGKISSEPINVITLRKKVQEINIIEHGKANYFYGESFDFTNYQLLVSYQNYNNELIPLDSSMLNIDTDSLKPRSIGINYLDIYFNGVKASSGLNIFIEKAPRILEEKDVHVLEFTKEKIAVNKILGASYAFYPKNNIPSEIQFQQSPLFYGEFYEDYVVFVKLDEEEFYLESNLVKLEIEFIPEFKKPELVDVTESMVVFKKALGFNLVMIDEANNVITGTTIIELNDQIIVTNLIPNTNYKFAFVNENIYVIYEENIYGWVKTKEALNTISFRSDQSYEYQNKIINFEYEVSKQFASLIEVNIKYYQNNRLVNPINVGVYNVLITNNLNNEIIEETLTITKRPLTVNVKDSYKVYGNSDPYYFVDLIDSLDPYYMFDFKYHREVGENVGEYEISVEVENNNYDILVNNGTLNILKRNININIDDKASIYGDNLVPLTYSLSEEEFEEELNIVLKKDEGLEVNRYNIDVLTINDNNFNVIKTKGIYEITKKELFVFANPQTITYGDSPNNRNFEVEGLVYGDDVNVLVGGLAFENYYNQAGKYNVLMGNLNAANYQIVFEENILIVNKKIVTIDILNSKRYVGQDNDKIEPEIIATGLINGDTISDFGYENSSKLVFSTTASIDSPQGEYEIEITEGFISNNYEFIYNKGILIIDFVNVIITMSQENRTSIYDGTIKEINTKGIILIDALTNEEIEFDHDQIEIEYEEGFVNVGNYYFVIKYLGDGDKYSEESERLSYTINRRDVILKINEQSISYGEIDPIFGYTDISEGPNTGLVNDDFIELAYNRQQGYLVGQYQIGYESISNANNYNVKVSSGILTIVAKKITINYQIAENIVYGEPINIKATANNLAYEDYLIVSYSGENAGNQIVATKVYASGVDVSTNYIINNQEENFIIQKRELLATPKNTYMYTGSLIDVQFNLTGILFNDDVEYELQTEIIDAGLYYNLEIESSNENYYIRLLGEVAVDPATATIVGNDLDTNGFPTYSVDYTDNSIKSSNEIEVFKLIFNETDYTDSYELIYSQTTDFDLSKGGTTFVVKLRAVSKDSNFRNIEETYVVYKFKSVLLNNKLYTIEDALNISSTETIIVSYNTSFASKDTHLLLNYDYEYKTLKRTSSLLLPFDGNHQTDIQVDTRESLNQTNRVAYSELTISEEMKFIINGSMTVNAARSTAGSTHFMGYVDFGKYSQVVLEKKSKLDVYGTLNVIGFIIGEGFIEAMENSKLVETLFIKSFRGGTVTSNIYKNIFPFNQFTANNIEVETKINKGVIYELLSMAYVLVTQRGKLSLIGPKDSDLITIKSGYILKTYDKEYGIVLIDIYGDIDFNHTTVVITVSVTSKDKDIPFDGTWRFKVSRGEMKVKDGAWIALLPGSEIQVLEGAILTIEKGGRISVITPGIVEDYSSYPNNYSNYYRYKPQVSFDKDSEAIMMIEGILNVENGGGIAGNVEFGERGKLLIASESLTKHDYKYIAGTSGSTIATLSLEFLTPIINIKTENNLKVNENDHILINIRLTDGEENILPYKTLKFGGEDFGHWLYKELETDQNGQVSNTFIVTGGWNKKELIQLKVEYLFVENYLLLENNIHEITTSISKSENIEVGDVITITSRVTKDDGETAVKGAYVTFFGNQEYGYFIEDFSYTDEHGIASAYYNVTGGWSNDILIDFYSIALLDNITNNSKIIFGKNLTYTIEIEIDELTASENKDYKIKIILKNSKGEPIPNTALDYSYNDVDWAKLNNPNDLITNQNGEAILSYHINEKTDDGERSFDIHIEANIYGIKKHEQKAIKQEKTGGSPFIYSEDEEGELHFEHEPISLSLIRTVEGTSYGTLRLLQAQDGVYYIQVVEEGSSKTMIKDVNLYAVDYLDDGSVLDLFFDIAGNPHTIREKLKPVSFTDQYGNSYLNEVLNKDSYTFTVDGRNNSVLTYYEIVFNRYNNNDFAKFMFSVQDTGKSQSDILIPLLSSFNAKENLWWLDQALLNNNQQEMFNIFNAIKVQVQVWDGTNWITQGQVELGSYIMESFLVNLDLRGITGSELKVRLVVPTKSEYSFDHVAIDFTENLEMKIHEMNLVSAMLNGNIDVLNQMLDQNAYVELPSYKDGVRLGFVVEELTSGYTRKFGVGMTGYIYSEGIKHDDELLKQMENKTFDEIKEIIIKSNRQDLILDIPKVEEFYYMITHIGSLSYEEIVYLLYAEVEIGR